MAKTLMISIRMENFHIKDLESLEAAIARVLEAYKERHITYTMAEQLELPGMGFVAEKSK